VAFTEEGWIISDRSSSVNSRGAPTVSGAETRRPPRAGEIFEAIIAKSSASSMGAV